MVYRLSKRWPDALLGLDPCCNQRVFLVWLEQCTRLHQMSLYFRPHSITRQTRRSSGTNLQRLQRKLCYGDMAEDIVHQHTDLLSVQITWQSDHKGRAEASARGDVLLVWDAELAWFKSATAPVPGVSRGPCVGDSTRSIGQRCPLIRVASDFRIRKLQP